MASFLENAVVRQPYTILNGAKVPEKRGKVLTVQIGGGDKAASIGQLAGVAALGYAVSVQEIVNSVAARKENTKGNAFVSKEEVLSTCAAAISFNGMPALDVTLCRAALVARIASVF